MHNQSTFTDFFHIVRKFCKKMAVEIFLIVL